MDEIVERVENNFINIYKKFDILDKKLNDYHMKFDKVNEMIDIIISDEYTKIHKTYFPMKNYDLMQDRFFIFNEVIDVPLKKNTFIIFEYVFNSEYINIPLIINLKIDDVLEKDFNIHLKEYNKIRHIFKLDYNITKINFYLYLYNNEIYNDEKMEYLKKISFNNKKLNLIYFLLYKYMNYYRKPIEKTINDVKLKMQIGALTVKITENINKINDLLEVDKDIKKDVSDNSNSINNMKNEVDLELSDKVDKSNIDNLLSDNYYDKNNIDLKFNDLYNKYYLDNKFDNIYDKTEINDKNTKLNRNIVFFNTNSTNHINKYTTDKQELKEDIKDNKDNLNQFIINTFSTFTNDISNLNNTQNSRLTDLEDSKLTETQSNKLEQLENIDLGNISTAYNHSIFNKAKLDKFSYYIKEFFMHNIDLVRRFEIASEMNYIQILQFEIDRNFLVNDIIKFFISIKLLYENMSKVYWVLYFKMDVHYKDDVLIKSFKKQMTSKGFLFKNLAAYNIDNMFKLNKDTPRLIFRLYMYKLSTAYKNNVTVALTNSLEENYCNLIWYRNH